MTATLKLYSLLCKNTGTSFGDDLEIYIGGASQGGEYDFRKGKFRKYDPWHQFEFTGEININFREDGDTQPNATIKVSEDLKGKGYQYVDNIVIKKDGRYLLYYIVI